ncbi:bifunctional dTDP-4-dehydrorhamnose 3,5-epimerase family protein/NAD(P)-dependent oxidoreductase [Paeniglutamicibacter sp. ABSL32-1]|uniref:sugar nucleotide-binding protein n=1 Tax=Paeniglutamicibacter quisquiliarum TaxID=2849498 RepID=UPI001C2D266A|nr:bifunctional dTDP-4-dehydrorhamnose 3,5-epimerase family protein/NAD(P)-dependent oxidoreductase [Paeniglutamicibacter quisquiliarum]MBV1779185.1 bifunctional dTDP-4-dehydrorhamnose 3,5-epimerase family protein/NAD(P)-dependent oxidoreductase [Paeniglutamicibacter quisquiliarum]
MSGPVVQQTGIPGLLLIQLPVHEDARGWFKENWQREKMVAAGLPDFRPVQNNVSFNRNPGTTRGIHAEPWDKYVAVVGGAVFGAWVDLRAGEGFGASFSTRLGPGQAVFVPRGVGNGFQTLEPDTGYSYLVTEHWSAAAAAKYTFLNLADSRADIPWPIPLERATVSEADRTHPHLEAVVPVVPPRTLVLGANGQVGRALAALAPPGGGFDFRTRAQLDIADPAQLAAVDFSAYATVINAAAYTKVDEAQTPAGRREAWATNVTALAALAAACTAHNLTLVHLSSDYVFDGERTVHPEDETPSPLGVYGQTKAAGDAIVAGVPRHYLVRTSWVVGDGKNFVATMARLASGGVDPVVVDDQVGRLGFATDLAAGILHLLETGAPAGTYNLSNAGEPASWARLAAEVFTVLGQDPGRITPTSTAAYYGSRPGIAPRPANSTLDLAKIGATGFTPRDQFEALADYLAEA